jgi:2-oxoglutarate dehydrogenase complex dehydrogenase (E1) component-like enzyme
MPGTADDAMQNSLMREQLRRVSSALLYVCVCTAGVNAEILKSVGKAFTALPEDFTPHRQIKKVYEQRRAMIESGEAWCGPTLLLSFFLTQMHAKT